MKYQTQMIAEMMYCPSDSQRKFQTQTRSQSVISVGSSAASPRRKKRRKSSANPILRDPRSVDAHSARPALHIRRGAVGFYRRVRETATETQNSRSTHTFRTSRK